MKPVVVFMWSIQFADEASTRHLVKECLLPALCKALHITCIPDISVFLEKRSL